ncbi:hypothetical protein M413DRAFT_378047 [Hebeloma cylindrosporum]|uniref:Ornithine cyclodeaminase n=1 Tax=Hebeloma cylindrosporum TaxID=76867 RepID=A0A0C2Y339_HEBCY|nr:hypothetical protein M413DRAFT_378047 [Hebeloma cylindrosporum h7]
MTLLVLSSHDVDALSSTLSPEELQLLMARVFARLSHSSNDPGISMPHRINIQMANHTALFMPARIGPPQAPEAETLPDSELATTSTLGSTAIKVVSVPQKDGNNGLPATTLVLDEVTGGIKAIVNARKLTALRNAAGSLLSTTLVGPTHPSRIVAFGAGQQVESHLDLHLRHLSSIVQCTIINRKLNERAVSLSDRLKFRYPYPAVLTEVLASDSTRPGNHPSEIEFALRHADIIICATSSTSPLFPSSWVRDGTHVILVGSYTPTMQEVDKTLILRALGGSPANATDDSKSIPNLLVDSREACLREAGELINAAVKPEQVTEIGELLPTDKDGNLSMEGYLQLLSVKRTRKPSEENFDGPVTIFKSVGVGLQDVAIANAIVDKALSLGDRKVGVSINGYDS